MGPSCPLGRVAERPPAFGPQAGGYAFLENKYYLDHLYTGVVVGGIKGPVARGLYWIDQHVINAVVNFVAAASRRTGNVVYRYVDQGAIDGTVNGSGLGAGNLGGDLRHLVVPGRRHPGRRPRPHHQLVARPKGNPVHPQHRAMGPT